MRSLTAVVALLACLAVAPAASAHDGPHGRADGTMLTWHGDSFGRGVAFGQGVATGIAGLVPVDMAAMETEAGAEAMEYDGVVRETLVILVEAR